MTGIELQDSIPLPIGSTLPNNTVHANSMLQLPADSIEIREDTENGWPTVIQAENSDGPTVGVAVDYLGSWHAQETQVEEIDLAIQYEDEDWFWFAVVVFSSREAALELGDFDIDGYNGYELVEWGSESLADRLRELLDEDVTPLVATEDHPLLPVHTIQSSSNLSVLQRMFGLDRFTTLEERQERVLQNVVPRDVRWEDKQNNLMDIAKKVEDSHNSE